MLLVLIFLGILILISMCVLLIIYSTVTIKIKNLVLENKKEISQKAKLQISLYLLGKLKIITFNVPIKKLTNILINKEKPKTINKIEKQKLKNILKILKKTKIIIEQLNLKIYIGTEDAILTSYATAGIASILGIAYNIFVPQEKRDNCTYFVNPIYQDKNMYYISLESTIKINMKDVL